MTPLVSVVVVSGSTRDASTNTVFARTAAAHPPAGVSVRAYIDLAGLPHFDPDDDHEPLPAPVAALRWAIADADAVIVCTPEYAGALPGAFKNLLDWTVGATVFTDKPVAWVKVAADARRGDGAYAELETVLGYVQGRLLPEACVHVPIEHGLPTRDGVLTDPATIAAITRAVASVVAAASTTVPERSGHTR